MHDPRLDRLARVLVRYSAQVAADDEVVILAGAVAEPAVAAVCREVIAAGGHPWVQLTSCDCKEALLKHGTDEQLAHVSPFDRYVMKTGNAYITFWGEENTHYLSGIKPAKQALLSQGRKPIFKNFLKRLALPDTDPNRARWIGSLYPTHAHAQDADMSLSDYADFVFRAGKLDRPNPIAAWKRQGTAQQRLADFLNRGHEVHIRAPGGTDIRLGIEGRTWINCCGQNNFPDGEVFTGPIEDATEGTVCYTYPAVMAGREVAGVRLTFKGGKVVDASADKNEPFLIEMLDQDKGARVLGELALGTNYDIKQFTRNILFDEKIGGTFHLAVGASIPESGGKNSSGLHWDMVGDLHNGGIVEVDGHVVSRNGRFTRASWPR